MGKYLNMVRKFEAERNAKQLASPVEQSFPQLSSYKDRYQKAAESLREDCFIIDATWLADHQPELWQRMTLIDRQLERLEARNAEQAEYNSMLQKLVQTVKRARTLYEQENQQKEAVQ